MPDRPRSPALQRAIDNAHERHRQLWNREIARQEAELLAATVAEAEQITREGARDA